MYSPLNSYAYIHWILDFKYILLLLITSIESKLTSRHLPTDCQSDTIEDCFPLYLYWKTLLYTQQVPVEILAMMDERDNLRKQDLASTSIVLARLMGVGRQQQATIVQLVRDDFIRS